MKQRYRDVLYAGEDLVGWARLREAKAGFQIEGWVSAPLAVAPDSVEIYMAELVSALSNLDLPVQAGRKRVGVLAPAMPLFSKVIVLPRVADRRRRATLTHEVAEALPYPLHAALYATAEVGGDELEEYIALVAVPREWPERICSTLARMGFSVAALATLPGGLWQLTRQESTKGNALWVDAGLRQTHLVGSSLLRSVPLGTLAHDYAFDAYVPRLGREVNKVLKSLAEAGTGPPDHVCLTGVARRQIPDLAERLERHLGLPVMRPVDEQTDDLNNESNFAKAQMQLLGSVLAGSGDDRLQLNLLPEKMQRQIVLRKALPAASATAAMLLLSAGIFYGRTSLDEIHQQELLDTLQNAYIPLVAGLNEMDALVQDAEQLAASIRSVTGLSGQKDEWIRLLTSLQSTLVEVEDVWIDGLSLRQIDEPVPLPFFPESEPSPERALELILSGRMIDRDNPVQRVSARMRARVANLAERLEGGPATLTVSHRRFDTSQPGILRFELSLILRGGTAQ